MRPFTPKNPESHGGCNDQGSSLRPSRRPDNSQNRYYRSLKPLLRGAGFSNTLLHELRHTCATIRFMKGQHSKWVFRLLGHTSEAFTWVKSNHVVSGLGDGIVMTGVSK